MAQTTSLGWRAYGALVLALSVLHYGVLSRFSHSDEGGLAWFRRRLNPKLPAAQPGRRRIWIHAVSAGESKVAELLRAALLRADPELSVVLSSTTYSGFARVEKLAGNESFVMPLDTPAAQKRLFETVRPDLLVLVESEYWPAQFAAAEAAGVPVVVVNATLSERSFARHQRNPAVAKRTLLRADRIYVQDEATRGRYAALGVPAERLEIAGNLKLAGSGGDGPANGGTQVAFGNIHRDEVPVLAPAIARLRQLRPDARIVLVPRYPGKTPIAELKAMLGPDVHVTTEAGTTAPLLWLDRMGVLGEVYAQSAIGVVCGTFNAVGGHDLVEPLQRGAASVFGWNVTRQRSLEATLKGLDAGIQVGGTVELADVLAALLDAPERRAEMVQRYRAASAEAAKRLQRLAEELLTKAQG